MRIQPAALPSIASVEAPITPPTGQAGLQAAANQRQLYRNDDAVFVGEQGAIESVLRVRGLPIGWLTDLALKNAADSIAQARDSDRGRDRRVAVDNPVHEP